MTQRVPCEFSLIRYVPDVVKGEFVNIGVLLREAGADKLETRIKFTRDWSRVRCMDADADTGLLEALEGEIGQRLRTRTSARDPKSVMEVLEDSLSNSVQMTEPRATLAENMTAGMEELMRLYVEPLRVVRLRKQSSRAQIQTSMRNEFERAGAWALLRKRIAAAMYTRPGDPLRIDCGYKADLGGATEGGAMQGGAMQGGAMQGGIVRMFHAVSLDGDVEAAKGLAFSAPRLREGVDRVEGAKLELTAVVEPLAKVSEGDDEAGECYRFGVEAMERELIRVVTINDLARAAETARRELGL